jgi:multicomponent Na+:H+ antiporter subunit G
MTSAALLVVALGAFLMLLAGVGILRLPDVFARLHSGTKSASLGLALILMGAAALLSDPVTTFKLLLALAFQFMTAPVAAHILGRAAYRAGVPLWEGSVHDDMAGNRELGSRD